MNYSHFVKMREDSWQRFERQLSQARKAPKSLSYSQLESLAADYRQILHDLSLARTRFAGTATSQRLQRLVLSATHWLHRDSARLPGLGTFISVIFPRAIQRLLPSIGIVAGLFVAAGMLGFSLTAVDPGLASVFLDPQMIDGLHRGEIWTESIFSTLPGSVASGAIATNNMSVALTAWAGGAVAGLGALHAALLNGLMLGSVLAITARYSMHDRLLDFIAAHGPLEISLILVCAGAGLHMGRALVRASDTPRSVALGAAAKDALIVLIVSLPWILLLGFVEGYISPSSLSFEGKLGLGLLLEAVFIALALNPTWRRQ